MRGRDTSTDVLWCGTDLLCLSMVLSERIRMKITKGMIFDTIAETGLVVSVPPEEYEYGDGANFLAIAPDGVECMYVTSMVVGHPDFYQNGAGL